MVFTMSHFQIPNFAFGSPASICDSKSFARLDPQLLVTKLLLPGPRDSMLNQKLLSLYLHSALILVDNSSTAQAVILRS